MTITHSKFNPSAAGKSGEAIVQKNFSAIAIVISPWAVWITMVRQGKTGETSRIPAAIGDGTLFLQALTRAVGRTRPEVIFVFARDQAQLTPFGKAAAELIETFAGLAHIPCIKLPDLATLTQPPEPEVPVHRRMFGGRSLDFLAWRARIDVRRRPDKSRQRHEYYDDSNTFV